MSTLGQLYNIETVALRIFNAYGPRQPLPPSHAPVIPLFLRQVLEGGSVVLFGGGRQTRDFVYIDDVVDALTRAAIAPDVNRKIINVGAGQEVSIWDLLRHIEQITGRRASVIDNASQEGGISRLVADINLAHETLGFRPRASIRQGLELLLKHDPRFRT